MKLRTAWHGDAHPFEGDITLTLRALPADAIITHAVVTLTPRSAVDDRPFEERFVLGPAVPPPALPAADYGVRAEQSQSQLDVELGVRRRVMGLAGIGLTGATLAIDLGGVLVDVGQRGTILVPPDTPLPLPASGAVPGLETSRLRLSGVASGARVTEVTVESAPSNLSVRLGDLAPFWSRTGPLVTAATSLDIAAVVQSYLPRATVEAGTARIPLIVHSDTLCRLDVSIGVEYLRQAAGLPPGLPEANLSFDYAGPPRGSSPLVLYLPAGASVAPGATAGSAVGSFEPSRVVGGTDSSLPTSPPADSQTVPVTPARMVACPVTPQQPEPITAVDLLVAASSADADLQLLVRADQGGKPMGADLLATPLALHLTRAEQGALTWVSAALPQPLRLPAAAVWLILQCTTGEAQWGVRRDAAGTLLASDDGGFSWRQARGAEGDTLRGMSRLRFVPSTFTMPMALRVGADPGAEVPLDRFEPLGRAELDLSLPDLGAALSSAAAATSGPTCPVGEHLVDGELHDWTSVGVGLGDPALFPTVGSASSLAVARDGATAYVATLQAKGPVLEVTDLVCRRQLPSIGLAGLPGSVDGSGGVIRLAAHPDGRTLYAAGGRMLMVLDVPTAAALGSAVPAAGEISGLGVSPDGGLLYMATQGGSTGQSAVTALDTAGVGEAALRGDNNLDAARRGSLTPATGTAAAALSVACDHDDGPAAVAVLCATGGNGTRWTVQLTDRLLAPVGGPVPLDSMTAVDVALAADGSYAVAAGTVETPSPSTGSPSTGQLQVIDPARGIVTQKTRFHYPAVAVALDPGRPIGHVLTRQPGLLTIDLQPQPSIRPPLAFAGEPVGLAVLGRGTAVCFVTRPAVTAGHGTASIQGHYKRSIGVVPVGVPVPQEWAVTAGTVLPVCMPGYGLAAQLGTDPSARSGTPPPASLAQVVAVQGACSLQLSFDGFCDGPDCVAEVRWLGDGCAPQRTDTLPIQQATATPASLVHHAVTLAAPPGVTQAEVRFSTAPGRRASIAAVSLAGTGGALIDAPVSAAPASGEANPAGWTSPTAAASPRLASGTGETLLTATGPVDAVLEQVVPVRAGDSLLIEAAAHVVTGTAAAVRVEWLGDGTTAAATTSPDAGSLGQPAVIQLTPADFDVVTALATVPAGAARARVLITVPPGGTLAITRIRVVQASEVAVPLRFTAQAPGELAVRDVWARYDVVPASPPAVPAAGLCSPAPAAGTPEGGCHCCCCGRDATPSEPRAAQTPYGRPVIVGACTSCGAPVTRHGGVPGRDVPMLSAGMSAPQILPSALVPTTGPPDETPLPPVRGIGRARLEVLVRHGTGTADRVARLDVPMLQALLPGVSDTIVRRLLDEARQALASNRLTR
jgi:hypothetical protein